MKYNLFNKEEAVIERFEKQSADFSKNSAEFSQSLRELIEAYRASLREQQRLIKLSDLQQEHLRQTTEDLNKKTGQLEEQAANLQKLNKQLEQEIEVRKQLEKELKFIAATDMLTGVSSRAKLWEIGEYEMLRRERSLTPLAVLMLDIDNFKSINDRYGHVAGDEVLRRFARICMDSLRATDSIGRLGGEEFAAVLPETTPATAKLVAERLRAKVEALMVGWNFGQIRFTVSIGVANVVEGETFHDIISRADQAMYMAKNEGRNRVVVYQAASAAMKCKK